MVQSTAAFLWSLSPSASVEAGGSGRGECTAIFAAHSTPDGDTQFLGQVAMETASDWGLLNGTLEPK